MKLWTDGRTDDGRTRDHGHPISSPCEPNGSGELKSHVPIHNTRQSWTTDCGCTKLSIFFIPETSINEKCNKKITHTVQPHYNVAHYSAVFNITRPCHGSRNDYFAICVL